MPVLWLIFINKINRVTLTRKRKYQMKLYGSQVWYTAKKLLAEKHARKPYRLQFTRREDDAVLFEKFYPTEKGANTQGNKLSRTDELWSARWSVVNTSSEYFFREFSPDDLEAIGRDAGYTILDAWDPVKEMGIQQDVYLVWTREWDNEHSTKVFQFTSVHAHANGDFMLSARTSGSGYSIPWDTVKTAWEQGEIKPLVAYDFDRVLAEYTKKVDAWVGEYKSRIDSILEKSRTFDTLPELQEYARDIEPESGCGPTINGYLITFEHQEILYKTWDKASTDIRDIWVSFKEELNNIAVELMKKSAETLPDTTPREKMIKAFATVGYAPPVEKYLDKIVAAIANKDVQEIYGVAHPTNKATRLGFTNITGVKLGRTRKEDLAILTAWAQG